MENIKYKIGTITLISACDKQKYILKEFEIIKTGKNSNVFTMPSKYEIKQNKYYLLFYNENGKVIKNLKSDITYDVYWDELNSGFQLDHKDDFFIDYIFKNSKYGNKTVKYDFKFNTYFKEARRKVLIKNILKED